uniref:Uncharacterized protein n=1 Tax=Chenopodium quinoa TaxID=63459 RepID=A0A803LPX6_CHEQI
MATSTNIKKIGSEAFMLLEQFEEQRVQWQRNQIHCRRYHQFLYDSQNYQVIPPRENSMDTFQAAHKYGGFMICEHRARKSMLTRMA